ncbi:MAG TPA: branched-chain amino acid ABC transporter substrate-binding protein [Candidatus Nitrosotalea sp.]|nr:branched-chain amino acid ABC transporter substrate-binding protein [Candidatus Nitrosotalea sp.]
MPQRALPHPRVRRLWLLLALPLIGACGAGPNLVHAAGGAGTVVIGAELPLSGSDPGAGLAAEDGIRFALRQQGTIDGFSLRLQALDDAVNAQADPQKGVLDVYQMAANPNLVAVIGPMSSALAQAEIPAANPSHLALVSPLAAAECLTQSLAYCLSDYGYTPSLLRPDGQNNFFRISAPQNLQGSAMADFAHATLHLRRVAVWNDQEPYGQMLASSFGTEFQRQGGSVVSSQSFNPSAKPDLSALAATARGLGAQAIYLGVAADAYCAGAGADGLDLMGPSSIADSTCLRAAGPSASGHLFASLGYEDPSQLASAKGLVSAYRSQYPDPADLGPYTFAAYDATGLVLTAVARAIRSDAGRMPSRAQVLAQIAATRDYPALAGAISLNSQGDPNPARLQIVEARSRPGQPLSWSFDQQLELSLQG